MKTISWNIAGRKKKLFSQLDFLLSENVDIICLQEVIDGNLIDIQSKLRDSGFQIISSQLDKDHPSKSKYFNVTASKHPISKVDVIHEIDYADKYLCGKVYLKNTTVEVTNIHIPNGSQHGWNKIKTIKQIYTNLAVSKIEHKILVGDWNTPQAELEDGTIITWGQGLKSSRGSKWDEGERLLLEGVNDIGLFDVFRALNGFSVKDYSWISNRAKNPIGRRYDHICATANFKYLECHYNHEVRENKLSDHSAIAAILEMK